jgi:DNA-binding NtrC family response regulator
MPRTPSGPAGSEGGHTTRNAPAADGEGLRVALLKVLTAGSRPQQVLLKHCADEPLVIGREGHATGPLLLADTEVSRRHATLRREGERWTLLDEQSRNGTFVNGARVVSSTLAPGDVIRVGRTLIVYTEAEVRPNERFPAGGGRIAGTSITILRVQAEIGVVAPYAVPVLVLGETGAGKELVAQEIHARSGREGAFVPVNCAAIPAAHAERELFGAAGLAGASAGGLFASAERGTLFLDELAETPPEVQAKLLRVLATGEVRPVGGAGLTHVDARVVAATNGDLGAAVAAGTFRADLLARLSGWTIHVPPLRERREDVAALAACFLAARVAPPLSVDALEALLLHRWPYNVRELAQVVTAVAVRAAGVARVGLEHLPPEIARPVAARSRGSATAPAAPPPLELLVARDAIPTGDELLAVLRHFDGNVARVAEYFGKGRQQIYRWAARYGIDLDALRR